MVKPGRGTAGGRARTPIVRGLVALGCVLALVTWWLSGSAASPTPAMPGDGPQTGAHLRVPPNSLPQPDAAALAADPASAERVALAAAEEDRGALAAVTGRVTLRGTGAPLPGVTVELWLVNEDDRDRAVCPAPTDADGRYRAMAPAPMWLDAVIARTGPASIGAWVAPDVELEAGRETVVDLAVPPGATLEGLVLDDEDRPVAGAQVRAWAWVDDAPGAPDLPPPDRSAVSDRQGRFALGALGPDFLVDAVAPDLVCTQRILGTHDEGHLAGGLVLRLSPARWVPVVVVDRAGAPVPDVSVQAELEHDFMQFDELVTGVSGLEYEVAACVEMRTDSDGRGLLGPLSREPWMISVEQPGNPRWARVHRDGDGSLVVVLGSGARVEGQVLAWDGAPIADALVGPAGGGAAGVAEPVRTDGAGRFVLEPIGAGTSSIMAVAPGLPVRHKLLSDLLPGATTAVTIVMFPGELLRIQTVDAEGQPVAGVAARLRNSGWAEGASGEDIPPELVRAVSAGDGRLSLGPLQAGAVRVVLTLPGTRNEVHRALEPGPGEHVVCMAPPRLVTLAGQVLDAWSGLPIPRYRVITRTGAGESLNLHDVEAADGTWSLRLDPATTPAIRFEAKGYAGVLVDVPSSPSDVDPPLTAALLPARVLDVTVRRPDGTPLRARLAFTDEARRPLSAEFGDLHRSETIWTDEHGQALVVGLPAARLAVDVVNSAHGVDESHAVDLRAPRETPLELVVTPGPERNVDVVVLGVRPRLPVPAAPSVWALLDEYARDACWPIDQDVTVRASDGGQLVVERHLSAAEAGAARSLPPSWNSGLVEFARIELPPRPLQLEVSAPGYVSARRAWAPAAPGEWPSGLLTVVLVREP